MSVLQALAWLGVAVLALIVIFVAAAAASVVRDDFRKDEER